MDATTSNRLSRGLFAASQGINQMLQLRMQMADKMFREKLATMQMQMHEQDRQDTNAYRQQEANRQDRAEAARETEAAAAQKSRDANYASMAQSRAVDMKYKSADLGIKLQDLDLSRQKLAQAIQDHGETMSSDKLKEATGALNAMNARIKNLQAQAATAQKAMSQIGGNPGDIAKAKTLYDSITDNIQQLNEQADAYTQHINSLTGMKPPTQSAKPLPKLGGKYIKLSNGSYAPYDPNNVPEGLNPKMVPIGTPRTSLQPGDVYTFDKPGLQMPNGSVAPFGQMPDTQGTQPPPDDD